MMDVESLAIFQVLVTDRTEALLPLDELPTTKFGRLRLGSSLSPVVLQGRVIGGCVVGTRRCLTILVQANFQRIPFRLLSWKTHRSCRPRARPQSSSVRHHPNFIR
jgi:hypothetical protein